MNSSVIEPRPPRATRLRFLWFGLLLLALIGIGVLVVSLVQRSSVDPATEGLERLALAEQSVLERDGSYRSYWREGGDRALEESAPRIAAGVDDARVIACDSGWLAAVRIEGRVVLRSSSSDAVAEAPASELDRPECISETARDAMLAELGAAPRPAAVPANELERPAQASAYRPGFHLTPPENWMNDPQRPFFLGGRWHFYYLYNADYPEGNGTAWYHATSTDLVHWENEGVAIEKFRNGLGDIETGAAVVDHENTAGFGEGAVIAIMTQQHEGVQRQSLFYSVDGGYSFTSYEGNPVMDNPGVTHWRDPKIIRDEANAQWVMVLAEGEKLGFYVSDDLRSWRYTSGIERHDLGILECPDLFQMDLDGDPENRTWVLAASANGAEYGRTTGLAYWTGTWDGERFTIDEHDFRWLDAGADYYASVTWDDPRLTESQRMASRYGIGWLNNWAYAGALPTEGWEGGAQSVVRELRLASVDGVPRLLSTPTRALEGLEGEPVVAKGLTVTDNPADAELPQPDGASYRIDLELERGDAREFRLRLKGDGERFVTVGYDFDEEAAFVARDLDEVIPALGNGASVYSTIRSERVPEASDRVRMTVLVDASSVEVFVGKGEVTLSSLVFPRHGAERVEAVADGGTVRVTEFRLTPLAPVLAAE